MTKFFAASAPFVVLRELWSALWPFVPDVAAELRASEERYRGIVETQEATVMRLDFAGRIAFVNEFCCRFVGMTRQDLIGRNYADWVHPDDRVDLADTMQALRRQPHRSQGLSRVVIADGSIRWLEWEGTAILDEHGTPVELQSIGRDVTARLATDAALRASEARHRELVEELRLSEEKLRRLARHQVVVREEERKRLGFDLHDGVGQELVGISILVEAIRCELGPNAQAVATDLDRLARYLTHLGEHIRALAGELRPLILHDLGLAGSLRSLANGLTSEATRIEVDLSASIPRLEEIAEIAIYRIAQEALLNVIRHAQTPHVMLSLTAADGRLHLEVRDGGCGFDPATRRAQALGIIGMEERALAIGGRLHVASRPGGGTTVRLECPLVARTSAS